MSLFVGVTATAFFDDTHCTEPDLIAMGSDTAPPMNTHHYFTGKRRSGGRIEVCSVFVNEGRSEMQILKNRFSANKGTRATRAFRQVMLKLCRYMLDNAKMFGCR